jgi:hypothetical protein
MIHWFLSGGVIMWPLLVLAVGVVVSAARAGLTLKRVAASDGAGEAGVPPRPPGLVPVLFWGGVALLVGALGTVTGLVIMARRLAAAGGAGGASPGLVWGGVAVALVSLVFGLLVFLLSGLLWFALDAWARRIARRSGTIVATLLVVGVSGIATACGDPAGDRYAVTDSAGIAIVENAGPDRPLGAEPVRLTALQPPESGLTAMPWAVVVDPEAGRVFAADAISARVVEFDATGDFVRTIGRAGDGPGEFRNPTALALDEDGVLVVWDARRGVISRWSAEGELLDERRSPINYWGPGFAIRDDGVVAVTQSTRGNQRRQSLVEAETNGEGEPTELFSVTRELVPLDLPGVNMPAPRIFAPDLIWTTAGDTVLVLNGPGYRIDVYADAEPVASIRRDIEPLDVTPELAAARVGAGPYRGLMRRAGITSEQLVAAVGFEEVTSPIEWLATSPSGRLWVSRGPGLPVPDEVDVFTPHGRYEGTFDAPGFPVALLSDTLFVALEITELGETVLGLYRLSRDPGASTAQTTASRAGGPTQDASASSGRVDARALPRDRRGATRPGTAPPPPDHGGTISGWAGPSVNVFEWVSDCFERGNDDLPSDGSPRLEASPLLAW